MLTVPIGARCDLCGRKLKPRENLAAVELAPGAKRLEDHMLVCAGCVEEHGEPHWRAALEKARRTP